MAVAKGWLKHLWKLSNLSVARHRNGAKWRITTGYVHPGAWCLMALLAYGGSPFFWFSLKIVIARFMNLFARTEIM